MPWHPSIRDNEGVPATRHQVARQLQNRHQYKRVRTEPNRDHLLRQEKQEVEKILEIRRAKAELRLQKASQQEKKTKEKNQKESNSTKPCKFGDSCNKKNCKYMHTPKEPDQISKPTRYCKFGPDCNKNKKDQSCKYVHPTTI